MSKKRYCWNCNTEVPSVVYSQVKTPTFCPCCGVLYPEKPKLEASLTLKQDKYLRTKSEEDLADLFKDLPDLTFNLICHILKGIQKNLDPEEIWDKTYWTLEKLISYYKEKEGFKINGSFSGYISQVILYPIFNKKDQEKTEKETSLETPLSFEDDKSKTLEDLIYDYCINNDYKSDVEQSICEYEKNKNLSLHISNYILDFCNLLYTNQKLSLMEMYQMIKLFELFSQNRNAKYFDEAFKTSSSKIQDEWEYMINSLQIEIRNFMNE